jgi:signal transduction histidine kinase
VVIEVTDNGCGIPVELQERVFTPFFSTKAQGTGLGLSLVSRIVREHEGLLSLDSMPGHGTTIRVLLPARSQTREYRRALGR